MKKILFKVANYEVKVRDILVVLGILLLLFTLVMCNRKESKEEKMAALVKELCVFPKQNVKDLNELLSRADLCSAVWYEDVDHFITRLKDQQKLLKEDKRAQAKELYKKQAALIQALEAFEKKQDDTTVNALEKALNDYQKQAKKGCS